MIKNHVVALPIPSAMLALTQPPCRSLYRQSPSTSHNNILCKPKLASFGLQQLSSRRPFSANQCSHQQYNFKAASRCAAQQSSEPVTPEILSDTDEDTRSLPSAAHDAELEPSTSQSGSQQLASVALGGGHKGVTTLLGFGGAALAAIAGKQTCMLDDVCSPALPYMTFLSLSCSSSVVHQILLLF